MARNKGIAEAKYPFVAFLDADDAWKPLFLENIIKLIKKYPEAGAFVTAYDIIRKEGRSYQPHHAFIPHDTEEVLIPNYFKSMLHGYSIITSSSICIRKEILDEIGTFPEEERLGEDKDMWSRIALVYPIAFSWYIGATYFENADNRTCLMYKPNYERYFIKTLQKKLDNDQVPANFIDDVKKYISKNILQLASKNIKLGESVFARQILKDKRTDLYFKGKMFWLSISYIPAGLLILTIKLLKFIRNYPLFYFFWVFRRLNIYRKVH